MTCWVVIPIKAPGACKTRLAGALDDAARHALVAAMLHHVVAVAGAAPGIDEVVLLGPSRHGLPPSLRLLDDPGRGLNGALAAAAVTAAEAGIDRLLFVSADLPHVTPGDLNALTDLPADAAAIAPDRGGTGTNALSLPGVYAPRFGLHYGTGSFAAHRAEARCNRLRLDVIRSRTLALDIDLPSDLPLLKGFAVQHRESA